MLIYTTETVSFINIQLDYNRENRQLISPVKSSYVVERPLTISVTIITTVENRLSIFLWISIVN